MDSYILSNSFDECIKEADEFSIWRTTSGDYVLVVFVGICVYKVLYRHDSFYVVYAALGDFLHKKYDPSYELPEILRKRFFL